MKQVFSGEVTLPVNTNLVVREQHMRLAGDGQRLGHDLDVSMSFSDNVVHTSESTLDVTGLSLGVKDLRQEDLGSQLSAVVQEIAKRGTKTKDKQLEDIRQEAVREAKFTTTRIWIAATIGTIIANSGVWVATETEGKVRVAAGLVAAISASVGGASLWAGREASEIRASNSHNRTATVASSRVLFALAAGDNTSFEIKQQSTQS
jgi:hypothetical protein